MGGSRGRVHRGAPGPHSIRGRAALAAVSIPVRVSARITCVRSPAKAPLSVLGTGHTMGSRPAAEPPFLMEGTHMTTSVLAQQSGNVTFLISLALMVAIFYFLLIRPQQRRARQQRDLLSSLAVGDEVITVGGMFGRITDMDDESVTLDIGAGRVRFVRQAIARKLTFGEPEGSTGEEAS